MEKLTEANLLSAEITELKHFIFVLDVICWRTKSNTKAIIKKKSTDEFSIFGSRYYGCGTTAQNINVPTTMIPSIVIQAKELLKTKQAEFDALFTTPSPQPN